MVNPRFWKGKKVFLTGHTGFKGSWLSIWLSHMGAEVTGYSLKPPTTPSLFEICKVEKMLKESIIADIRDYETLKQSIKMAKPETIIHMAAQPLVRESYKIPLETYSINVMGTVNVLEAIRTLDNGVKVFLNVTTDKVYENKEWIWGYRENENLGGYDPYSNSKSCSELVTSSYRNSYFYPKDYKKHGLAIATARAGNVIGGGDFATDRLIPDIIRSILKGEKVQIRNPDSIRPWQHVLEPLSGYLLLIQRMVEEGQVYSGSWNFGPNEMDAKSVIEIVKLFQKISTRKKIWDIQYNISSEENLHEANYLKLDISKVRQHLKWNPVWSLETALEKIVDWVNCFSKGDDLREVCIMQIEDYSGS